MRLHIVADLISLHGEKWSGTNAILSLSKTGRPIFSNSAIAGGPVMSLAKTKSTWATSRSPAWTASRPACWARIFSVIVIPITITLLSLYEADRGASAPLCLRCVLIIFSNVPSWISARTCFIAALVSSVMIRLPVT